VKTVIREAACPVLLLRLPERKLDAASGPGRVPAPAAFKANQFDAMILDLDGVITRTATIHARAWKRMFDDYLRRREAERREPFRPFDQVADYRRYVDGKPRYDGVRSFLESRGIHLPEGTPSDPPGQETICGLGNLKDQWFLNLLVEGGGVEVFEDTLDALRRWRALGLKTAVVSSSKNCDLVLRAAGLVELFDVRVDGNTAEELRLPGKPAPDTFLEAAHRLGVAPSRAAVFEDACAGVQAGRHGHFGTVVGVARQESQLAALQEAGADVVVRDLREFRLEE
jgi:alpha,alpha-trehalase